MTNDAIKIDLKTARIIAGMLKGYANLLDSLEPPDNAGISDDLLCLVLEAEADEARDIRRKMLSCINQKTQ